MTERSSASTTSNRRSGLLPVALFTGAYMSAAAVGALTTGNREFVFYIGVMLVLITAVGFVHRRVGFSPGVLWGLSVWGLLHMAGGLLPVPDSWPIHGENRVLYSWWIIPERLKYDQVVHAYGFAVTTFVCWEGLRSILSDGAASEKISPSVGMVTLCAAASLGFGALNEVVEFAATLMIPSTNVGGYLNTGWDLVANLVGAVSAALILWINGRTGS